MVTKWSASCITERIFFVKRVWSCVGLLAMISISLASGPSNTVEGGIVCGLSSKVSCGQIANRLRKLPKVGLPLVL